MATSSILGGARIPEEVSGKDMDALGPSDNSDSGSDAKGAYGDDELDSDSDAVGTGERASVGRGMDRADADILPDRVEGGPDGDVPDDSLDGDAAPGVEGLADDESEEGEETVGDAQDERDEEGGAGPVRG